LISKEHSTIGFYCSSNSWGGLEMNSIRYARWMKENGWRTIVFCVDGTRLHHQSNAFGLTTVLIQRNKKYFDFINAYKNYKLFKKHNIDLIWFRDTRDFDILSWVKKISGGKFKLLYQQAMQFGVAKKDFFHTLRFSSVDAWVSTLNFLADQVKNQTRINPSKIHVIPLGVDDEKLLCREISQQDARDTLKLPQKEFIAGIIGRLDKLKGQHTAIEALALLHAKGLKLHLLVVGESTLNEGSQYEQILKSRTKTLGLESFVHFRPYSRKVEEFYRAIDLFLLCSKGETFGTVTIEAMAFGKAIIATNSSGTPEILQNGKLGWLFEPMNESDLASKWEWIMTHPEDVKQKSEMARSEFDLHYSKKVSIQRLEQLIQKL
jgi:glycosyltransferase involved in cell wall biosynthesis